MYFNAAMIGGICQHFHFGGAAARHKVAGGGSTDQPKEKALRTETPHVAPPISPLPRSYSCHTVLFHDQQPTITHHIVPRNFRFFLHSFRSPRLEFQHMYCCFLSIKDGSELLEAKKTSQIWKHLSSIRTHISRFSSSWVQCPCFTRCCWDRASSFKGSLLAVGVGLISDIVDIHAEDPAPSHLMWSISLIRPVFFTPTSFAKKNIVFDASMFRSILLGCFGVSC